jgi:hypothetical protein
VASTLTSTVEGSAAPKLAGNIDCNFDGQGDQNLAVFVRIGAGPALKPALMFP